MCGENYSPGGHSPPLWGSPPRVRGKPGPVGPDNPIVGLTPACAGKTAPPGWRSMSSRAHPRVCGENWSDTVHTVSMAGSPPRVRGKRGWIGTIRPRDGLTPACAGKTDALARRRKMATAHPRVCGENTTTSCPTASCTGSPPRVRGKRRRRGRRPGRRRLTPACAGKTICPHEHIAGNQAHPRVCGENGTCVNPPGSTSGSPPRVRGKPRWWARGRRRRRLTPACAGKTPPATAPASSARAHPRVCGENVSTAGDADATWGSPPRVRGKLGRRRHHRRRRRLTPACAGKTGGGPPTASP